jgi:hypothetical protein
MPNGKSHFGGRLLNCLESPEPDEDSTYGEAVAAGDILEKKRRPQDIDLREEWWKVDEQPVTCGACTGYAAAYDVLRWHYVKAGLIKQDQCPSARFIWMANKETDDYHERPTTFLEPEGTST